jgi:hypothetical protein
MARGGLTPHGKPHGYQHAMVSDIELCMYSLEHFILIGSIKEVWLKSILTSTVDSFLGKYHKNIIS